MANAPLCHMCGAQLSQAGAVCPKCGEGSRADVPNPFTSRERFLIGVRLWRLAIVVWMLYCLWVILRAVMVLPGAAQVRFLVLLRQDPAIARLIPITLQVAWVGALLASIAQLLMTTSTRLRKIGWLGFAFAITSVIVLAILLAPTIPPLAAWRPGIARHIVPLICVLAAGWFLGLLLQLVSFVQLAEAVEDDRRRRRVRTAPWVFAGLCAGVIVVGVFLVIGKPWADTLSDADREMIGRLINGILALCALCVLFQAAGYWLKTSKETKQRE